MVSTDDRPTPASRASLTDRKSSVSYRTLRPALIPNSLITFSDSTKQISKSWLYPTDPFSRDLSSKNPRRIKSLSDIPKTITRNINRSVSNIQSSDDSRDAPDEILNSDGLKRSHVAKIAKMLDSGISGNTASIIRSIDDQRGSSISISLIGGHDFPSVIKKSGYLSEDGTVSDSVNKSGGSISQKSVIVPCNGLWNSGYIGLEAYSRMVELLHDDCISSNYE